MGSFSQDADRQHRQVVFLSTDLLEEIEQYKVTSGGQSLSYACYELVKLGLLKAREISDSPSKLAKRDWHEPHILGENQMPSNGGFEQ